MRIESPQTARNGGWIHKPDARRPTTVRISVDSPPPALNPADIERRWQGWNEKTSPDARSRFAGNLGVDEIALGVLGAVWAGEHHAWAFPMRNEDNRMIGIRFRNHTGAKWALRGSHNGLFIPQRPPADRTVYICEGPTDTAAALMLGLYAVGRPCCLGQEEMINLFMRRAGLKRAVIVADADEPGLQGADRLQDLIRFSSCILIPMTKDLREFVRIGMDATMLNALMSGLKWSRRWNES